MKDETNAWKIRRSGFTIGLVAMSIAGLNISQQIGHCITHK